MNTTATKFQIVQAYAHFDDRDAIRGYSYTRHAYAYANAELAGKLAARMSHELDDAGYAFVVPYGGDLFRTVTVKPVTPSDWTHDGFPF